MNLEKCGISPIHAYLLQFNTNSPAIRNKLVVFLQRISLCTEVSHKFLLVLEIWTKMSGKVGTPCILHLHLRFTLRYWLKLYNFKGIWITFVVVVAFVFLSGNICVFFPFWSFVDVAFILQHETFNVHYKVLNWKSKSNKKRNETKNKIEGETKITK